MSVTIHTGDCRDVMRTLPTQLVHTCISSPPYFGLRDYGIEPLAWPAVEFAPMAGLPPMQIQAMTCSLGLEPDPWAFVGHMVLVYREVRRVLRDDGTCWVNLGDSYAGTGKSGGGAQGTHWRECGKDTVGPKGGKWAPAPAGFKAKDLMGIPWRVALALQADGWYLRQDIIWAKPNPMPESVTDRCTKAHEYLFLLTKSARYYFDHDAIREPVTQSTVLRLAQNVEAQHGSDRVPGKTNGTMKAVRSKRDSFKRDDSKRAAVIPGQSKGTHRPDREESDYNLDLRNKRSVWTVATQPYKEAHFATFPPALIEPCVLAGCPVGGTVLDPFGGSGTTGEVAEHLGRDSILIELSPTYVALSERRTQQQGLSLEMTA